MAKQYGQRLKILCILDILRRYSDEQHPLNASEICDYLENMGVSAERKSVYNDIAALSDFGYDIVKSGSPRGWFLGAREFEEPEIYLLADAVRAAKFITVGKSRELIGKLDSFLSNAQAAKREKRVYFDAAAKCSNEEIYYNIDKISDEINRRKKIRLDYASRELSADREIVRREREMTVSPYALTWQDDHYYLIGNYEKYNNLIHLRVDRMRSVEITCLEARPFSEVSEYDDYFNVSDYTKRLFSMYGGVTAEIELSCNKKIIEQVLDRFSEDIFIKNVTDSEFGFSVKAVLSDALVTWILNYGENIRVIAPEELKLRLLKRIKEVEKLY